MPGNGRENNQVNKTPQGKINTTQDGGVDGGTGSWDNGTIAGGTNITEAERKKCYMPVGQGNPPCCALAAGLILNCGRNKSELVGMNLSGS